MSALGFAFWVIAANIFPKSQVGIATVVITAAGFVTSLGLLGLDQGIVRFLASADDSSEQLDSSLTLALFATFIVGVIYIILAPTLSPHLAFLRHNLIDSSIFILLTATLVTNSIVQATFISKRRTGNVLLGNSVYSIAKIVLLPLMVGLGSFGIVSVGWFGMLMSLAVTTIILHRNFAWTPRPRVVLRALRTTRSYSSTMYGASIENGLVQAAIPLVVLNRLGAARAADYYIVLSVFAVLGMIASATGQSLLAEGAHSLETLHANVKKAGVHITLTLAPLVIFFLVGGRYVLEVFGRSYADQGTQFLRILALSAPFVAWNYIADSIAVIYAGIYLREIPAFVRGV